MLPDLWSVALSQGVNPLVVAAQFAKETGWGRFGGAVTPDMHNPCGLKRAGATQDRREDHAVFPDWPTGILAQCQHLCGYAGRVPSAPIVDPRWSGVAPGTERYGSAPTVDLLGGQWAPSPTYGTEIAEIVHRLRGHR